MINIRTLSVGDLSDVQRYASNPELSKMSYIPSPYPENGAEEWYKFIRPKINANQVIVYVVEFLNEFAGIVTLNGFSKEERRTNIDYWIRADLQGKGIGTSAVEKVINLAVELGITHFNSGCLARNMGSKKF
ncbi:GNAT family N-acetyltransferase [Vibrio algarum]|uniref:GNAT family N-acetyltransferase n=1 Tax=Vibrio algarum TaxID=3020714 RepID=A0ABT4YWR8_9VIBR|nr:GNAT family N-acetyltransferase [Vibrio sp. KJ40-1]MDB1126019.1 GNAT family N-acetyltransferase [Vibrio sp. KJ40-1]